MRGLLFLILIPLISCRENIQSRPSRHLNFDSLFESQVTLLSQKGASLEKVSTVNKAVASATTNSRDVNWSEELKAFGMLEAVNKPVYVSAYEIAENPDKKSNLMVKTWVAKTNIPVRSIKIFYLPNPLLLKRVEAKIEQNNFVFSSVKELTLDFSVLGGDSVPERYEISGSQSFFWGAPQYYSLEGLIRVK